MRGPALPALLLCLPLTAAAAPASPGVSAKPARAADLRVTGQLDGWKEKPSSFTRFDPRGLFDIIDGGAPEFNDRGLVEGIHQELTGKNGAAAEIFAEDFGRPDSARSIFAARTSGLSSPLAVPGFDTSSVRASPAIGGLSVFAVVDRFYVELVLTGIADRNAALENVRRMLGFYWSRIRVAESSYR